MASERASIEASTDAERRERLRAIGMMMVALLCFACLDATAKYLSAYFAAVQIIFCRYLSHLVLVVGSTRPSNYADQLWHTNRRGMQFLRALFMLGATTFNFIAVRHLQLSETMSIFFATPFVVALLSGPVLGEWVGPRRLAAICVGFLGVLIVMRPGLGGLPWQVVYSVLAMLSYACYGITTRILAPTEKSSTAQFYAALTGTLAYLPFVWGYWQQPETWMLAFLLALLGVIGWAGHQFMITAHRYAPAAILSPFIYTELIWMIGLGFILFGDVPTAWTLLGASVVIASGLYLLWRERKVKGDVTVKPVPKS
ncbi:DMT family transporter [Tepidamorphus sp. 3E244]|uniref:DMT family transporter n=1 Tax=Tepidamorphus sp. 3E244 TaxID=3385498 RepID=UPI0038FC25F3